MLNSEQNMESNDRYIHINNEREHDCIQPTQHIDENTSTPIRTATQMQKMSINQKKYKLRNVFILNIKTRNQSNVNESFVVVVEVSQSNLPSIG